MATLYDLTEEYQALLDMAEDPEVDPEILADTLEGLGGEIEDKADSYAKVIRQMTADMEGLKAEIDRLDSRKKTIGNNIDRMKRSLESAMIATNKRKFKTALFSFNIQKNPASIIIDEQHIKNIPEEYLIEQDPKINKVKMKEDLQNGVDLDGVCHLEQTESIRIR